MSPRWSQHPKDGMLVLGARCVGLQCKMCRLLDLRDVSRAIKGISAPLMWGVWVSRLGMWVQAGLYSLPSLHWSSLTNEECGGLNENTPHWLIGLNSWSTLD